MHTHALRARAGVCRCSKVRHCGWGGSKNGANPAQTRQSSRMTFDHWQFHFFSPFCVCVCKMLDFIGEKNLEYNNFQFRRKTNLLRTSEMEHGRLVRPPIGTIFEHRKCPHAHGCACTPSTRLANAVCAFRCSKAANSHRSKHIVIEAPPSIVGKRQNDSTVEPNRTRCFSDRIDLDSAINKPATYSYFPLSSRKKQRQ